MQMWTTKLTDEQLLTLAKVALTPGGLGSWANALAAAGANVHHVRFLRDQGYVEQYLRPAAGGSMSYLKITDKGRRDLALRFVG